MVDTNAVTFLHTVREEKFIMNLSHSFIFLYAGEDMMCFMYQFSYGAIVYLDSKEYICEHLLIQKNK